MRGGIGLAHPVRKEVLSTVGEAGTSEHPLTVEARGHRSHMKWDPQALMTAMG